MIYPTIADLTKGEFNRYQLTLATAKCARIITDEYVKQRVAAENQISSTKEGGSTIISMIDPPILANEKAVKNAINGLHSGEFRILSDEEAAELHRKQAEEAERKKAEEEERKLAEEAALAAEEAQADAYDEDAEVTDADAAAAADALERLLGLDLDDLGDEEDVEEDEEL